MGGQLCGGYGTPAEHAQGLRHCCLLLLAADGKGQRISHARQTSSISTYWTLLHGFFSLHTHLAHHTKMRKDLGDGFFHRQTLRQTWLALSTGGHFRKRVLGFRQTFAQTGLSSAGNCTAESGH